MYRFTFSDEIVNELYQLNRIHQFSDKQTYKEAWKTWCDAHQDLIDIEIERLTTLGYEGDVLGKLYHTSRYYIRNQFVKDKPEKKTTRKTRTSIPKEILRQIEQHIQDHSNLKPIESFRLFHRTQGDILQDEKQLHKAYMNRYCVIKQKNKTSE
jgi:hypothetical protein|tara:strand:+ start:209 stop:670 length:462 start_codon:yes stop_codon:yes gene_type:complete